ncbi:MAG: hypothetical protein WC528_03370 [Patescibacteria group bacterium]
MLSNEQIEKEIRTIKERNRRVELDKAWETSWIRKIIIFILTYLIIVIFMYFSRLPNPFVNAIVPALAFVLSNLTLSFFKNFWLKNKK